MRVIYTSKAMSKKCWGARYTLGVRYLSKNTVIEIRSAGWKLQPEGPRRSEISTNKSFNPLYAKHSQLELPDCSHFASFSIGL
jgi:hypothetical protein